MATPTEVKDILDLLNCYFPYYREKGYLTDEVVQAYAVALADIPPEALQAGALQYATSRGAEFFPTVSKLREHAIDFMVAAHNLPTAPDAWGTVRDAIRQLGYMRKPDFSPLIERCIRAVGGWAELCTSENIPADRARFIQAYDRIVEQELIGLQMLPTLKQLSELYAETYAPAMLQASSGNSPALPAEVQDGDH